MLNLQQTPKLLQPLVKEWSPQAFVVSFKLETDVNIISKKARESLNKNSHQVIVVLCFMNQVFMKLVNKLLHQLHYNVCNHQVTELVHVRSKICITMVIHVVIKFTNCYRSERARQPLGPALELSKEITRGEHEYMNIHRPN